MEKDLWINFIATDKKRKILKRVVTPLFSASSQSFHLSISSIKHSLKKCKLTVYESFENSRESVCDGLYFNKVERIKCEDSRFTTSRLYQRFSSEYAPKTSCLNNLRKRAVVNQSFSKFLTCNSVVHSTQFNQKWGSYKIFQKKLWKNLNVVMGKTPWWKCCRCRVYRSNFDKN